jgi:single-strand DNA-binding protein
MSLTLNKVTIIGYLGANPDVRSTAYGKTIANLSVATTHTWRDKQSGVRREKTEWHRVVIFNQGLAEIAQQYLKKGLRVYVEGNLHTRKWQDQSGQDHYTTEIVLQGYDAKLWLVDAKPASEAGDHRDEPETEALDADAPGPDEIPF